MKNFNFAEINLENLKIGISCKFTECWHQGCKRKDFCFYYSKRENCLRKRCSAHKMPLSYKLSDKDIFFLKINGKI